MTPSEEQGGAGTVGAWLASLEPAPPAALQARLAELLAPYAAQPASQVWSACLEAGEGLLSGLLASGSTSRVTALDLLSVDALVTYAFEAAATQGVDFEERAAQAMARIAALPDRTAH